MNKTSLSIIFFITSVLLLVPYIAMQFTNEVNWSLMDFLIAFVMLMGTGIVIALVLKNMQQSGQRMIILVAIVAVFILTWLELAVGIFGTPFSGS